MRATLPFYLLALAACASEPERDIFVVEGIVEGQVTNDQGIPLPDAWVVLDGLYPLSNGNTVPVFDSTQTDTAGKYRGRLAVLNMPDTVISFALRVWPPIGSGMAPDEILGLGLRLTAEPARDTFRMNIFLSP